MQGLCPKQPVLLVFLSRCCADETMINVAWQSAPSPLGHQISILLARGGFFQGAAEYGGLCLPSLPPEGACVCLSIWADGFTLRLFEAY